MLEDETLDSLLRCWSRLDETAEDFVQGCLRGVSSIDGCQPVVAVDAPPVVAPPVVTSASQGVASSGTCRPASFRLHGPFDKAIRWAAVMAGCSAALVLVAIGWRWLAGGPQPGERNQLASHSADSHISQPEPPVAFATLAKCSAGAAWETPHAEGDRLATGELKLTAGTAELHFDKGTVACLTGPVTVELRGPDEVFLEYGSVSALVPPPAVGFAVSTPLARIVDLGTEFDVFVKDAGVTETVVRRGRVSLRSQEGQESLGNPVELAAGRWIVRPFRSTAMLSRRGRSPPLRVGARAVFLAA